VQYLIDNMKNPNHKSRVMGLGRLSAEETDRVRVAVIKFLRNKDSIKNEELRELTAITYDQATSFFNAMVKSGILAKIGRGSGIKYKVGRMA
jgi:hypothetical protein